MNSSYFLQKTVTIRTGNKFSRKPVSEVIPNFLSAFSDYDIKAIQSLPGMLRLLLPRLRISVRLRVASLLKLAMSSVVFLVVVRLLRLLWFIIILSRAPGTLWKGNCPSLVRLRVVVSSATRAALMCTRGRGYFVWSEMEKSPGVCWWQVPQLKFGIGASPYSVTSAVKIIALLRVNVVAASRRVTLPGSVLLAGRPSPPLITWKRVPLPRRCMVPLRLLV